MFAKMSSSRPAWAAWSLTALRIVTGLVLIAHGWPKLFGDPAVKAGMLKFFESTVLPMPGAMLVLAGVLEVVGGVLLILGAFMAITSAILMLEFLVIVLFVKLTKGFSSMELDLMILVALFTLHGHGAGAFGAERLLSDKKGVADGGHASEAIGG
ncbi:MAG: DoxX family protein [Parcubacteria group bacterium]|nr:DoxX family protein [Parcubacteria group bacterium]